MKKYILGWLKIALLEKNCSFANTQCHIQVEDWGCVGTLIRWEESFYPANTAFTVPYH